MSRFVVTELKGFRSETRSGKTVPGVSVMVIDTAYNHRVMATYRSEDFRGYQSRNRARELGAKEAARLEQLAALLRNP